MAGDPLDIVRGQLSERVGELQRSAARLSSSQIAARMDAIRAIAAEHGMNALVDLASASARAAGERGRRVALHSCLEHMDDAIASVSPADGTAILAALAVRLH